MKDLFFKGLVLFSFSILLFSCSSSKKSEKAFLKKSRLYYGKGTRELLKKEYTQAIISLKKSNQLMPGQFDVLNNLGLAFFYKGYPDKAIVYFKRVLKKKPNNIDALNNIAGIYFKKKEYVKAEKIYRNLLKKIDYDMQYKTYYNLALIADIYKQNFKTRKLLLSSIAENTNFCPSHYLLALKYLEINQLKQASKAARKSTLGSCYSLSAPVLLQAKIYKKMNLNQKAYDKYNEVIKRFNNPKHVKDYQIAKKSAARLHSLYQNLIDNSKKIKITKNSNDTTL